MAVRTDNSIVIHASLEKVWDATNDVERWPSLFTEYAEAKILERNGNTVVFRLTMHPDESGKVWSWVSERTADPAAHFVKAHRIETGPFEFMNIEWYYEEVDGDTRMRWVQEFTMKANAPANDAQMEVYLNENTKKQMAVIKQRIEEGALGAPAKVLPGAA
jgi:aromatase